jgi:hypothetical protein
MNTKQMKIVLATMADKIQELEKDIKIKEYTINMLQRKLKECNEKTEDSNKLI